MRKKTIEKKATADELISRKEAIQKAGKYAAFTAASMMLLMSPASGAPQDNSKQSAPVKPKRR